MNFGVHLTRSAVKDLDVLSPELKRCLISDIASLSVNPLPFGIKVKKLKGFKPPLYRFRSGDFRVLYRVQKDLVIIMRIIDRKELERIIRRIL